jgi:acyl-coenzyme A synthetase/AMP-(fatty) acid ligase
MIEALEAEWSTGTVFWPERDDVAIDLSVRDGPILSTLAKIVQCYGDHPAVQDHNLTLSFREMWNLVARLASAIEAAPVRPGPVAIMLPPDVTYFPAFLACLANGRPSVLLDAAMPLARNMELLRQTGATLVLEPAGGASAATDGIMRLPVTSDIRPGASPFPDFRRASDLDAPALILCTSGSTGRPKAIVHSQRTIMHRAWYHANAIGLKPDDFCLSLSPPATFGGINGLLTLAVAGAATRFIDLRELGLSGLVEKLQTLPVTSLRATPSLLRILANLRAASRFLAGLRNVTMYGEPVMRADVAALRACLPSSATIFAGYGSTESCGMGWYPSADDALDAIRAPAGRPPLGIDAIILDDEGKPCGPDTVGELVVRSRYNALGEWQDGRCVPGSLMPDNTDSLRRIHRTGDLARRSADGIFLVVGRKDRMLKINGQRIEPAEIEEAIRRLQDVADCAVVQQQRGTNVTITAYVVLQPGVSSAALNCFGLSLRDHLPIAMVPSRFVPIASLPLLPGGKVDYLALRS